ncbi:MAG: DUF21 domain-containing protein [Planctomycetales bacterium]|nr:DUF21 domain-containing protein [Planctomycetales bacterium]
MPESISIIWAYIPGMLLLLTLSGFFSGSEAAFFSLSLSQRRSLEKKRVRNVRALSLLARPERLLMGILFWNLAINLAYFSLVSRASLSMDFSSPSRAALFTFGSLVSIIVLGEFLPKSVAVLYPVVFIRIVSMPLNVAIRLLDGFLPAIKLVNEASRRLLWPGLEPEPYLEIADLDRAVELSTGDSQLLEHERSVLRNIIGLSEIRVEEWMRPRTQYLSFKPPLSISQLEGRRTPSGYMLVTSENDNELVAAIDLTSLLPEQCQNLAEHQRPLVVVPWCATIADALKRLRENELRVAVVVNEFGETIGILTWDEIFEAILQVEQVPSQRALAKAEVRMAEPGVWLASGLTKLRRLERVIGKRLDFSRSLTVAGVVQEQLRRLPEAGDVCVTKSLKFEVVEASMRGDIVVRVILLENEGSSE